MRRAAPTAGLSPQLIKHFAIVTVTLTALLALFATEANWGAKAQLEESEARNRLMAAEAAKLGARKIESKLKIRRRSVGTMGGDVGPDSPPDGGGSFYPDSLPASGGAFAPPGAARSGPNGPMPPGLRPGEAKAEKSAPAPKKPTEAEIEAMLEASRQRSGSSSSND